MRITSDLFFNWIAWTSWTALIDVRMILIDFTEVMLALCKGFFQGFTWCTDVKTPGFERPSSDYPPVFSRSASKLILIVTRDKVYLHQRLLLIDYRRSLHILQQPQNLIENFLNIADFYSHSSFSLLPSFFLPSPAVKSMPKRNGPVFTILIQIKGFQGRMHAVRIFFNRFHL